MRKIRKNAFTYRVTRRLYSHYKQSFCPLTVLYKLMGILILETDRVRSRGCIAREVSLSGDSEGLPSSRGGIFRQKAT